MIDAAAISEILSLYKKHGWTLRRVLLSEQLQREMADEGDDIFGSVEITASSLDAAWFSRKSKPEFEAWEIRHLSSTPFALVEVLDAGRPAGETQKILRSTELKMKAITNSRSRSV